MTHDEIFLRCEKKPQDIVELKWFFNTLVTCHVATYVDSYLGEIFDVLIAATLCATVQRWKKGAKG